MIELLHLIIRGCEIPDSDVRNIKCYQRLIAVNSSLLYTFLISYVCTKINIFTFLGEKIYTIYNCLCISICVVTSARPCNKVGHLL